MRFPVVDTVRVRLVRPWGPHSKGAYVDVDVNKAATLDELGYLEHPEEPKAKRRKGIE